MPRRRNYSSIVQNTVLSQRRIPVCSKFYHSGSFLHRQHFLNVSRPITRYPGGPVDKPVALAAKRLGATPTQVLLSWVRAKGVAIVTYVHYTPMGYHN